MFKNKNIKQNLFKYSLTVNIIRSRRGPSGSSGDAAKIEFKECGDRKDAMKHLTEYKKEVENIIAGALSQMSEVKKREGMIPTIEFKNQKKLNELQTASSKISGYTLEWRSGNRKI